MMERQAYPTRLTAGGRAEPPYDVAGWTLPLQMGLRVIEAPTAFQVETERLERVATESGTLQESAGAEIYTIANASNDDFTVVNALLAEGIEPTYTKHSDAKLRPSPLQVPKTAEAKAVLQKTLPAVSSRVGSAERSADLPTGDRTLKRRRIALYQPWMPSMDEGWTRYVLEKFKFPFTTVHNAEIRAGGLQDRFDVLLIPSIQTRVLENGYGANETEPAFVGGLGAEGVASIRGFVRAGGTLVCLDNSCDFAISALGLPVKDVLKGLATSEFYGPGSILRAEVSVSGDPLVFGVPDEIPVYFDQSAAFEATPQATDVRVILRYAKENPLESGWLLGPAKLEGKAALVRVKLGDGSVVLFGFPPQHRAQTHGTFRLLFNALLYPRD
jgi:hypothetical protein